LTDKTQTANGNQYEESIRRISILYELGTILTGGPKFEQELDDFLNSLVRMLGASSSTLVFFPTVLISSDPDIKSVGISRRLRERMTFDMNFVGKLRSAKDHYLTESPFPEIQDSGNSWLVQQGEETLGVLVVCRASALGPYEHGIVSELRRRISVALYNRRLYSQQEEANRIINASIRRDRDMQISANKAKSRFLAVMSHELRTPLNGVIGMASIMLDDSLTQQQQERLEVILNSAHSLVDIVGNVLELDSIESGLSKLKPRPFNLPDLIGNIAALGRSLVDPKRVEVITEIDPSLATSFIADDTRLRQTITNLVSNATKFTEDGRITIRLTPEQHDRDTACIRCTVTDTGPGIPAAELESVFEPYRRTYGTELKKVQGAGLGLTIAQQLATLLGGSMGVESKEGKGTSFWFTAKLKKIDSRSAERVEPAPIVVHRINTPAKMRVLLAGDNKVNLHITTVILNKHGWNVDTAQDGLQAVDLYRKNAAQYDLILMDCQMPHMDGLEATRTIRAWEGEQALQHAVPIIAVTANAMEEDRQACLDCGMNGFLTKPFTQDMLLRGIREILA